MAHCWFNIAEAVAIYVNPPSPVVTRESPHMPEVVTIIKSKGRTFTSSYEEEQLPWNLHYLGHAPSQLSFIHCSLLYRL